MTAIDKTQFGPWALITGASSGIGREFARQIAASGINLVLVARRETLLKETGAELTRQFGVEHRVIVADLSEDGSVKSVASATDDLDIGLIVSNAGTGNPGKFLSADRNELTARLRLNTLSHLDIACRFCSRLSRRKRGGILFVGAMGAEIGIPYMANDAAAKAYVQSFAQALHVELKPLGVHVTVLPPGMTDTPVLAKFGLNPQNMPMKPMKVEQCVSEGLKALQLNRSLIIPGRINRILNALVPASVVRSMMAKMFEKTFTEKPANPDSHARLHPVAQPTPPEIN
jgi:short-subunit dehydrogenase